MNRTPKRYSRPCFTVIFCGCITLLLAACGQTGPLYLPDESGPAELINTQPVSEEAAEDTIEENEDTL